MDSVEDVGGSLDRQFDKLLVEMKPHVMRLSHKSGMSFERLEVISALFAYKIHVMFLPDCVALHILASSSQTCR